MICQRHRRACTLALLFNLNIVTEETSFESFFFTFTKTPSEPHLILPLLPRLG